MTPEDQLPDLIFNEFDRLEISTNQNSSSGLMTEYKSSFPEGHSDLQVVRVYDDFAEGYYDAKRLLPYLQSLHPQDVTLKPDYANNIWQIIREFEV